MKRIIRFVLTTIALATYKRGINRPGITTAIVVLYNPILSGVLTFILHSAGIRLNAFTFLMLSLFINGLIVVVIYLNFDRIKSSLKGIEGISSSKQREMSTLIYVLMILLSGFIAFVLAGYSSRFN